MVNFITRSGNLLKNGATTFTYAGANVFWLGMIQEGLRYPTHTEIDDALATVKEMGGTVIRSQSLGMPVGFPLSIEPTQNTFNDAAFEPIDYTISQCAALGLRLIIPLCDTNVTYMGSTQVYSGWRGVSTDAFFTDAGCISDFETRISHILNHVNQYSNVAIKNDPTIMLWETGNELRVTGGAPVNTWTSTIAAYIKSIATNALVADGFNGDGSVNLTSGQVALTGVDAYTLHYYGAPYSTYASQITTATTLTNANSKVCYIGEYDWLNTISGTAATLATFCTTIETSSLAGDTFWSLLPHNDLDGYDLHPDTFSMYYPGVTTDAYNRGQTLRTHAYTMSGVTKPAQETPTAPPFTRFSATSTDTTLTWSGVVAARFYQLERSLTSGTGPWTVLSSTLPQDQGPYTDNGSTGGWYRVAGINGGSVKGAYSAVVGGAGTPPTNGSDPHNPYGVTIASRASPLKNIDPQVLADAHTLGLGWVRLQVRWIDIETSQGVYDFSVIDDCVSRCMSLNLNVQFAIQTPPPWRVLAGSCGACNAGGALCINGQWHPHDPTQTANFAGMLSKRYNGVDTNNTIGKPLFISAIEIGNEEMNNMFIPGAPDTYAGQVCKEAKWFIPVLQKCAPVIRTNSPNTLIGLPGLVKSGFGRAAFMTDLYNNNCKGLFDYANIHTYPGPNGPNVSDPGNNGETLIGQINEVWNVMNSFGDGAKDVWITEIGWSVPNDVSEATRQNFYTLSLDDMRTNTHVGVVNWFTMNYTDPTKNLSSTEFSLTHLASPQYTPTFGTLQSYINKFPSWEDGSTTSSTRDLHARFKLKTSAPVQVKDDVAARLLLRAPGTVTQRTRDLHGRFRIQQVIGSGGIVKLPGQVFVNGVSNYIFGTNMSQDFATNTVRNTPLIQTQINAGGFTVMRCNIPVNSTNAFIDQTANACNACGTQMLVILDQTNLTWNQSLVTYLDTRCLMYELGNEPDINGVTTAQYLAAWNNQIPTLRAINPSAAFIGPALGVFANVNSYLIPWLKGCVTAGNLPDGVSYHVYPCTASTCDQTCCTPKSGNFQTDAGTLRAAVLSVTSAPIALCLTEWNIDATNPPKAYTYANPFNTTWTEAALDSMVAGNLDLACQWDAAGNAGSGFDDLISTTSPFAQQVQYAPMVNRIAQYAPSTTLNDLSTRLNLRLAGTTQVLRNLKARLRISAVAVPIPNTRDMAARYRSRQVTKSGGGGKATQIMIVVMENRSWQEIFGSGKANWPLTNALAAKYANTTNFFGTFHPSLPNYIAMLAGSRLGCNTDGAPGTASCGPFANNNVVDSLESAGVSWKSYFENIPSAGYTGGDTNGYVQHHNPFVYFTDIRNTPARLQKVVNTNGLIADLNSANPPRFVWVTPNINDDGHTGGMPDQYITNFVASVQQTNWYAAGGAIIVVWDEGAKTDFSGIGDAASPSNGGGPTGCFVVSAGAKNFGLFTQNVNHYGMMKAVCETLGITQLADEAHTINGDISAMFGTTSKSVAPIDFYTRFRLQFPGRIRDMHTRIHTTPSVAHVQIIGDTATRLRIAPLSTTNSTKDTHARARVRSGTTYDIRSRCMLASNQTTTARDVRGRISFTFGTDSFIRANQTGWGVSSDGETWTQVAGAATASITNNTGQVTGTGGQQAVMLLGTTTVADAQAQVDFTYSSSTDDGPGLILRATGSTSYYRALAANQVLTLSLTNGTTTTSLATLPLSLVTLVPYTLKFLLSGQNLSAKVWQVGTPEPDWMLTTTDATLSGVGQYGIRTRVGNPGDLINYRNYVLSSSLSALQKTKDLPARLCLSNDGDTFTRASDLFGTWGSSDSGSTWVQVGAFSPLGTTDSQGLLNSSFGDTYMLLGSELEVDVDCHADLTLAAIADSTGIFVRFQSTDNWYLVHYLNGALELVVSSDGVHTVLASASTTMSLGVSYTMRIQAQKTTISAKIWATGTTEPAAWTLRAIDATYDGVGQWGLYGNASSTTALRYDNFVALATSRNVANDLSQRLVLQALGTLDASARLVLLSTKAADVRNRLVLGIVRTRDSSSRLRFATLKGNDASSRVRVLAATQQQRFFAGRFVLQEIKVRRVNLRVLVQSPTQQRDTQQRMRVIGRPFLDTPQRFTLAVPRAADMRVRLHMGISNPLDVQARLITVPSPLLDASSRCNLSAVSTNNAAGRVVIQTLNVRNVGGRLALVALQQKDTQGRTRFASPAQTKDAGGRFQLSTPTVLPRTTDYTGRLMIAIDQDTFIRANQSGWGTASGGSTWAKLVGSIYTQSIASNKGQATGAASVTLYTLGSTTLADVTVAVRTSISVLANTTVGVHVRSTATTTNYRINLNGTNLVINKDVSGTNTTLATASFPLSINTFYFLKVRCIGANISAKAWLSTNAEPSAWTATANDSAITAAGQFGVTVIGGANADIQSFDSFVVTNSQPSLVTNDIASRVRLVTSTQRDAALRFCITVPSTQTRRDLSARVVVSAIRLQDTRTRTRLLVPNKNNDMAARLVIQAVNTFDTPARLHYDSLPVLHDTLIRAPLAAQNSYPLVQRLRLQPSFTKDAQARLLLTSQVLPVTLDLVSRINMALAQDSFNRANQTGWGNSSDGYVWTQNTGSSSLSISGDEGLISSTSTQGGTNVMYLSTMQVLDIEVLLRVVPHQTAGDSGIYLCIGTGGFRFLLSSGTTLSISYVAPGGSPVSQIGSAAFTYSANTAYRIHARVQNSNLLARAWLDGTTEPTTWMLGLHNTSTTAAGHFGVKSLGASGTATVFSFDNFVAYDARPIGNTFDLPQRLRCIAARQNDYATRFQITAIVNITRSLLDDALSVAETSAFIETLGSSDTGTSSEFEAATLALSITDSVTLADTSASNMTTLLADATSAPSDTFATSESLAQSDNLTLLDISRTAISFTDVIVGLVPGESESTALMAVLIDTLTLAGEVIAELVQSTLGDTLIVPVDQAASAMQVQNSDSVTVVDALNSSEVYTPSDVLGVGETTTFAYSALVADMLALLQEAVTITSSVALSDSLTASELLSALILHAESDLLTATDASAIIGALLGSETLTQNDTALYLVTEQSTDTSNSTDTLVIVAFSFMTGIDALTSSENQSGLVSFAPLDVLASLESDAFALAFAQVEPLVPGETITATDVVQTLSDVVTSTETALAGLAVSGSDGAPVGNDALLGTTFVTFAPDVVGENSTLALVLTTLVGDASTPAEQGTFLLLEQIISTDVLTDASTTRLAFAVTDTALLPLDSSSASLAWDSSDALTLTDISSVAGSVLFPGDSTSVIDALTAGTLFSILTDVLTLAESTALTFTVSTSDQLATSESTRVTGILQSIDSSLISVESTLLTLLQTEQETTPVGIETATFLNPSAIIGTDSLLATEQVSLLLTVVQSETVSQSEQTAYAVLVRLVDSALAVLETALYRDVSFEPVIAYLRSGTQTAVLRQGTIVARRRDGNTSTIRR